MGNLIAQSTYNLFLVLNLGTVELPPIETHPTAISGEQWYAIDFDLTLSECAHLAQELTPFLNDNSQAVCEPTYMGASVEASDGETPEKDY